MCGRFFEIEHPLDHVGFFVGDEAFRLTFIHKTLYLFREIDGSSQMGFFLH